MNQNDYVIQNGKLIGDFESLYLKVKDPWNQSRLDHVRDSRRLIAIKFCEDLMNNYLKDGLTVNKNLSNDKYIEPYSKQSRIKKEINVVELGCGFGYLTETLRTLGLNSIGIDISSAAINTARTKHPDSNFRIDRYNNFDFFYRFMPNVFILAEITWYVLDTIDQFIIDLKKYARSQQNPIYLIHLLSIYPEGVQKYGKNFFTNYPEILNYFDLDYIESGFTQISRIDDRDSQGTYFIARL